MSRERLTSRVAGEGKGSDSYDMNGTGHASAQPSAEAYVTGTPESFGEGVAKKNWKDPEARNEMNVADITAKSAATEAVATVKALEKKAVKCMVASQRMLPGAADDLIVKQAIDLMNLPEEAINATLARQETLANSMKLAAAPKKELTKAEEAKLAAKKAKEAKLEALKKEASDLEIELTAKDDSEEDDETEASDKSAKKECKKDEAEETEASAKKEDEAEETEASTAKKDDEAEETEAACKKEEEDETEASDKSAKKNDNEEGNEEEASAKEASLLDTIFNDVISSDNKKGATKLSGIVKKEASSDNGDSLAKLWNSAPDVGSMFQ